MLLHQMTFENALLYNFLTNCLTSIVGIISKMGRLESVFHCKKEYIWNITHFGKFSLATSLSANFLRTSDTFIIAAMLNEEAVAIFNLPVKLMDIIEIPIRSFVATGMSAMAVAHNNNNNEEVTNVLKKYSGMLTMFFIPMAIAVLFLAPLGVSLLGGAKYVHTYSPDIYRLFMFFALLYPIERFTGITLDIINRPQINFYKVILMLALNIAGDALLILLFGNVYGAVVASLIITIAGLWYGHHHLKKHLNYTLLEILQTGYTESLKLLKLKR
ncbi:MAG: hypothetical protein EBX41_08260 [Chitinophagia bacterium]|nr:hypothetical protein [Chitinophagia bacterium]